jgi:hypothetical protein
MERVKGYKDMLDFYYGRQWEGRERRGERRLTFNYAKVFIEKITSYLMSDISFTVDALEDSDKARDNARREIEAEAARSRIPAGAPQRTPPDMSGLSAREKIQYGLGGG